LDADGFRLAIDSRIW